MFEKAEKGLSKTGEIVAWLKGEFELGHGHANAIAHVIQSHSQEEVSTEDAVAAHFTGQKGRLAQALRRVDGAGQ